LFANRVSFLVQHEYDSASKYYNHLAKQEAKNNQEEFNKLPSNALEVLTKILSIPQGRKLLSTKECIPLLV